MKKSWQRVISSALALSMMASTASPAALAAGGVISSGTIDSDISSSTEEKLSGDGQLVIENGYPNLSHASSKVGDSVYYGTSWSFDSSFGILTLEGKEGNEPWNLGDELRCDLVVGTSDSRAWVIGGLFYGNVQVVNGSIDGVFLSSFTNEPGNDCSDGYMVFQNSPSGVDFTTICTSDSNFRDVRIGMDLEYMLYCYPSNVYVTSGENHYFILSNLSKEDLYDINGHVLDLHENTSADAASSDNFFGSSLSSTLVDILPDESGNGVAKVYYLSAEATSEFTEGDFNEELFLVFPLVDTQTKYELNALLFNDPNDVEIVNGYPDLSRATRQEGSVYYGSGWSYDTSTQTLQLTETPKNSHGYWEDLVLGSKENPVLCNVIVGTSDIRSDVDGGHFAGDVTLVNGQIYRGVFYESAHFTNVNVQDFEDKGVGYCVFVNEPTDDVVSYSKVTTNDAALAAKMETCMNPQYTAKDYTLPGGTIYGTSGKYHMFTIFGIGQEDLTDINGQELNWVTTEEIKFPTCNLTDASGTVIATAMFASAEEADKSFGVNKDLLMIIPMDDDVHTFELNQKSALDPSAIEITVNGEKVDGTTITVPATGDISASVCYQGEPIYFNEFNLTLIGEDGKEYVNERPTTPGTYKTKVEFLGNDALYPATFENYWTVVVKPVTIQDATELPKDEEGNITVKSGQIIELPKDEQVTEPVQNEGTIASGNFNSVTGGEIAGGTVAEAKDVKTISGGDVKSVENVQEITGGSIQEVQKAEIISGGTVAYVADVQKITGGVIGAESNIPDSILEAQNPAVLKLVDENGEALLDARVNEVIAPQDAAVAVFALENDIRDTVKPVAYIFDGTRVTIRYTGEQFDRWTVDGLDASDVNFNGTEATFSLEQVDGQTVVFTAHTTQETPKPVDPKPEEKTYTITMEDGLINGKTSATVKAGETVALTLSEIPEGMAFQYWSIPSDLLQALIAQDSTFSNKVENLSFQMPDMADAKDTSFTIRAAFGNTAPEEEDETSYSPASIATGVVAGGAAATVLGWQLYNIGTELYLDAVLPQGTAVPANRQELALLLWQNAGKPEVPAAPYADVAETDTELQQAARWAVSNGLMAAKDNDAFAPEETVSKWTVIQSWKKAQKLK